MKHKHKFYPTNETLDNTSEFKTEIFRAVMGNHKRKWICFCGKTVWVEEK